MEKKQKINVEGLDVVVFKQKNEDYISLTDIAKHKNPEAGLVISHWLSTRFAIEFMGIWERMNNPNFKVTEFSNFKNQSGANGFVLSVQQWVKEIRITEINFPKVFWARAFTPLIPLCPSPKTKKQNFILETNRA